MLGEEELEQTPERPCASGAKIGRESKGGGCLELS